MTPWEHALREIAEADAIDAGARYPQLISDAGVWRGPTADEQHARMNLAVLDPASVRRTSFPWAGHVGAVRVVVGPSLSRRRVERRRVA